MIVMVFSTATAEESVITVTDSLGRNVTVKKPVKRVIALGNYRLEAIKVLNASENVVGIGTNARKNSGYYFPNLCNRPDVGTWQEPNHEVIVSLRPDLVITSANADRVLNLERKLTPFGIPLIGLDFYRNDRITKELEALSCLTGREVQARQYILWRQKYEKQIRNFVAALDPEKMPRVYMEWGEDGKSWGKGSSGQVMCVFAGGNNIASNAPESPTMSMEWVAEQNPEVIIKCINLKNNKWGWSDVREPGEIINRLKQRPGLSVTDAVNHDRVYVFCSEIAWGLDSIVAAAYWTKWFHPESEIEPENIYREYLERFLNISYPENQIFAYPEH